MAASWLAQPNSALSYQAKANSQLALEQVPNLVSALAKLDVGFEVQVYGDCPERYLYHPGLGILRQQLSQAGELLLREDAVIAALQESLGNLRDFERRLRLLRGTAWLDHLDSYRVSAELKLLPKAV